MNREEIEKKRKLGDQYYKSNLNNSELKMMKKLYNLFEMKVEKSREIKQILTKTKTK